MIKTIKSQKKDANKEEERTSTKQSDKNKHKFYPGKNSSKIIIESEKPNVLKNFFKF